jgi:CubicO group peptidase (beta-lactamase class C family)
MLTMPSSRTFRFALVLSAATATILTVPGAHAFDKLRSTDAEWSQEWLGQFTHLDSTELDSFIVAKMTQYHIPGVATCVTKDADVVWTGAYGWGNIEDSVAATDTTMFLLASISKLITGTAVMQLCEDSLFGLDDPINDYLDSFQVVNPYYQNTPITFRMLLTHTSQIEDNWTCLETLYTFGADSPIPLGDFLEGYLVPGGEYYSSDIWTPFPPGEKHWYSNVGFTLLGYLVEEISGVPFDQYCDSEIFAPLGMNRTSWRLARLDRSTIAMPYDWTGGTHVPYGHYAFPFYPCGLLRSSSLDLSRFLRAFLQGGELEGNRILESSTVDMMTTHQLPNIIIYDYSYYVGLAWQHFVAPSLSDENLWCWGHTGGLEGVCTWAFYCPEPLESWSVTVLMNLLEGSATYLYSITGQVAQFAHDNWGTMGVDPSGLTEKPTRLDLRIIGVTNPSFVMTFLQPGHARLDLYDMFGRLVTPLWEGDPQSEESITIRPVALKTLQCGVFAAVLSQGKKRISKNVVNIR